MYLYIKILDFEALHKQTVLHKPKASAQALHKSDFNIVPKFLVFWIDALYHLGTLHFYKNSTYCGTVFSNFFGNI